MSQHCKELLHSWKICAKITRKPKSKLTFAQLHYRLEISRTLLVHTRSRLTPHSMQNLAVSTGNLLPHSWQKRERRGGGAGAESRRGRCSDASDPLELSPGRGRHVELRRDDERELVCFSAIDTPQFWANSDSCR